jgi:hypothetical protein
MKTHANVTDRAKDTIKYNCIRLSIDHILNHIYFEICTKKIQPQFPNRKIISGYTGGHFVINNKTKLLYDDYDYTIKDYNITEIIQFRKSPLDSMDLAKLDHKKTGNNQFIGSPSDSVGSASFQIDATKSLLVVVLGVLKEFYFYV